MREWIFGAALASAISGAGLAQETHESDYQANMLVPIEMMKADSEAIHCGLRDVNWSTRVVAFTTGAADILARREWPGKNPEDESTKASQEDNAMQEELVTAALSGENPTPDQCNDLAASGYLTQIDKVLAAVQAMSGNRGN